MTPAAGNDFPVELPENFPEPDLPDGPYEPGDPPLPDLPPSVPPGDLPEPTLLRV